MKIKKLMLGLLLGTSFFAKAQSTQVIDLSTGVVNGTSTLIAPTNYDDTWQVEVPGSSTFVNVKCTNGSLFDGFTVWPSTWAGDSHVRWVSPYIDGSGNGIGTGSAGTFYYKTTFNLPTCPVTGATIALNKIGADNHVTNIQVNSTNHPISATFNPLSSPPSITLAAGELVAGANSIIITVNNESSFTGLLVYGNLTVNFGADANLIPSITGPSAFCYGSAITFTGSSGTSSATNYYWEILESNSAGVPTGGGYQWNSWYTGAVPTTAFSFPNGPTIPCGHYYKVKLAVVNACTGWAEISKVIYINCPPVANAGPDVTICKGSCATIGTTGNPTTGYTYNWTFFNDQPWNAGSGQTITVCPTVPLTYTLTVTNSSTGCKATDAVNVNVVDNSPNFTLSSNLNPGDNFYTVTANPTITNTSGIAGFGYQWYLDEIVSPTNTTVISGSSACCCYWWTMSTSFNGYDGPYFNLNTSANNPMHALTCPLPTGTPVGHLAAGHTYRITRGTWSTACPWQQYSVIVYMSHSMNGNNIQYFEDTNAPDYSTLTTSTNTIENSSLDHLNIYPNPSNGIFTIETGSTEKTTLEVFDMLGKKVLSAEMNGQYKLDLSNYTKGIYMIKMNAGNKQITKKIILE